MTDVWAHGTTRDLPGSVRIALMSAHTCRVCDQAARDRILGEAFTGPTAAELWVPVDCDTRDAAFAGIGGFDGARIAASGTFPDLVLTLWADRDDVYVLIDLVSAAGCVHLAAVNVPASVARSSTTRAG